MNFDQENSAIEVKSKEELRNLIDRAIKKVSGSKENDLCKYLPGPTGGYMHHFTLKKLKTADPSSLAGLIDEFIIRAEDPEALDPKPRAPRGSRKKRDIISFTRSDLEKVLDLARRYGDKELISKFSPQRPFPALKRDLIRSIREEKVNHDLWTSYIEVVNARSNLS